MVFLSWFIICLIEAVAMMAAVPKWCGPKRFSSGHSIYLGRALVDCNFGVCKNAMIVRHSWGLDVIFSRLDISFFHKDIKATTGSIPCIMIVLLGKFGPDHTAWWWHDHLRGVPQSCCCNLLGNTIVVSQSLYHFGPVAARWYGAALVLSLQW